MRIRFEESSRFADGRLAKVLLIIDTGVTKIVQELTMDDFAMLSQEISQIEQALADLNKNKGIEQALADLNKNKGIEAKS